MPDITQALIEHIQAIIEDRAEGLLDEHGPCSESCGNLAATVVGEVVSFLEEQDE